MNILLVEKDTGLIESISIKIEELGFSVSSATSGTEALTYLKEYTPDMMLLNYSLPDFNGKELIEKLKAQLITCPPFIITTIQGDERLAVDMMKLGAMDYLVKDIIFLERLPNVVKRVIKEIESDLKIKHAEERLIESEAHFRTLIENSSDVISILDDKGFITYESPSHEKVLGYDSGKLIGRNVFELVHPEDRERISTQFVKLLKISNSIANVNFRFLHKDGNWIYIEGTGTNLLHTSKIRGVVVNYRDVSEKKQAEKALIENEVSFRAFLKLVKTLHLLKMISFDMFLQMNKQHVYSIQVLRKLLVKRI